MATIEDFERELINAESRWCPVLPSSVSKDRFKAIVMTTVSKNQDLLKADLESFIVAISQAAQDGLLPDGRDGVITTFWDKRQRKSIAQWTPMVTGIIKRCREKGELTSISAQCVYRHDEFEPIIGSEVKIIHKPNILVPRLDKDIVAAYAVFKNGSEVVHPEIMTRDEIEKARAVSRSKDGAIWRDWYGEMCRKTVIRRGSKSVPLSSEIVQLIERDDQWVDFNLLHEREAPQPIAEPVKEKEGPPSEEFNKLIAYIESCQNIDTLNEFSEKYKDILQSLREPEKVKLRSRYYERQREFR